MKFSTSLIFIIIVIIFATTLGCKKSDELTPENFHSCQITSVTDSITLFNNGQFNTFTFELPYYYDEDERITIRTIRQSDDFTEKDSVAYRLDGEVDKVYRLTDNNIISTYEFTYSNGQINTVSTSNGSVEQSFRTTDTLFYQNNKLATVKTYEQLINNASPELTEDEKLARESRYSYYTDDNLSLIERYDYSQGDPADDFLFETITFMGYGEVKNPYYGFFFPDLREPGLSPFYFSSSTSEGITGSGFFTQDFSTIEVNKQNYPVKGFTYKCD